jgi:hypothetical protein
MMGRLKHEQEQLRPRQMRDTRYVTLGSAMTSLGGFRHGDTAASWRRCMRQALT